MERMLLRSPEISLAVIASFFSTLSLEISTSEAIRTKLLPSIITSAKSVALSTRSAANQLFDILFTSSSEDPDALLPFATQLLSPLKMGKTSSPDHRTTLFIMLGSLPSFTHLSTELVSLTLSLLPKESNEATLSAMMRVLCRHLPTVLLANSSLSAAEISALVKGMQEVKPATRRLVCAAVGDVLWTLDGPGESIGEAARSFSIGVLPGLEFGLKTVLSNPLNSPAGPMEGYIAVAVLKGRLGRWGVNVIDEFIANNPTLQTLYTTGLKPSFLVWDKVYRKLVAIEDETWLLHALHSFINIDAEKLGKDQSLRYVSSSSSVARFSG
jgi:hypothetical protein